MAIPNQDLKAPASTKVCKQCGVEKSTKDFYANGYRPKYKDRRTLMAECKECTKERTRTRYYGPMYAEIKGRQNDAARKRTSLIKALVFAKYSGGDGYRCACCGETELIFLTLDHIHNDGNEFRRKTFGRHTAAGFTTYSWLFKNGCPEGFQVLCANCNHGKRMNNGVCPHQVRRNDHPETGVGSSDPKREASHVDEDMVSSAARVAAASKFFMLMSDTVRQLEGLIEKWREVEAGVGPASRDRRLG